MTATQAPTPGPLSASVRGAANGLCYRLACLAPLADEPQHQFMDGIFTGGPRLHYCAKCAADFDVWDYRSGDAVRIQREPKSLAPTAPVEASGSELTAAIKAVQDAEFKFRRGAAVGGLKGSDFTHYAQLQIAIKAAVVAAGGTWK